MGINELCKKYSFTYDEMAAHYKIKSKMDTWYVPISDDENEPLELYHENNNTCSVSMFKGYKKSKHNNFNQNSNKIWHRQLNSKLSLKDIFKYISKHDNKYEVKKPTIDCEVI